MWLLLLPSLAHADTLPPGERLEEALALHLSTQGFHHLEDMVEALLSTGIQEPLLEGELACSEDDPQPLTYVIEDLDVAIDVAHISILPSDGRLDLDLDLAISAARAPISLSGTCQTILSLPQPLPCELEIPPTDPLGLGLHVGLRIDVTPEGAFDVVVDDVSYGITWSNPIVLSSECWLSYSLYGLVLGAQQGTSSTLDDLVGDFLDPVLGDLGGTLEQPLEDALNGLALETTLPLLGVELDVGISPSSFRLDEDGLFLGLGSVVTPSVLSDCVPAGDGSPKESEGWPVMDGTAWGLGTYPYDMALVVNRDLFDQLLWNVWASGLLCADIGELAGLPLSTGFLGSLYGEDFEALFPEDQDVSWTTYLPAPPRVIFDTDLPFAIAIDDLGIEVASELELRQTRICRTRIDGVVGIDPGLSGTSLAPDIQLDLAGFEYTDDFSRLLSPGYSEGVRDALPDLLSGFIPAGDSLIAPMDLPLMGMQLDTLWFPDADRQWHGAFVILDTHGVQPIALTGCSGGCNGDMDLTTVLGCDDSGCNSDGGCSGCSGDGGCEGGCNSGTGPMGRVFIIGSTVLLTIFRRRR